MVEKFTVEPGCKLLLHYTLSTESEILESSGEGDPLELSLGSGRLHPLLEEQLLGCKVLEPIELVVDPSLAFGDVNPQLILEIPRHKLPENLQSIQKGDFFEAKDPKGQLRRFRLVKVEGAVLTFDGNHELAGEPLYLEAKILRIMLEP